MGPGHVRTVSPGHRQPDRCSGEPRFIQPALYREIHHFRQPPDDQAGAGENASAIQEEEEPEQPWTRLDWAILAVKVLLWLASFYLCLSLELGLAFVLTSGFAAIWLNLGRRKAGAPSAYSVFNPNCEAIEGTLTAEQFEREIRLLRQSFDSFGIKYLEASIFQARGDQIAGRIGATIAD